MGWISDDGLHDGYVVPEFRDGQRGIGVIGGDVPLDQVVVQADYFSEPPRFATRPASDVVGWRLMCDCRSNEQQPLPGSHRWVGELITRVAFPQSEDVAFFGLMYYSALRPEEAVNFNVHNLSRPPIVQVDGWGELHVTEATPHVGRHWTDEGSLRERRPLKHRVDGEARTVPVPPDLVVLLRRHLKEFRPRPDGRIFYGVRTDLISSTTYMLAWRTARTAALTDREQASPLARRPYDLRHAAVSTWLNAGVSAPAGRRVGRPRR